MTGYMCTVQPRISRNAYDLVLAKVIILASMFICQFVCVLRFVVAEYTSVQETTIVSWRSCVSVERIKFHPDNPYPVSGLVQCSKLLPVHQPEADNFGGGLGTFL